VSSSAEYLNPAEAAKRLGVSAKALRLYEERGLVTPSRTAAGWRAYGPGEMGRAAEIVALRALGLSLAQVSRVLGGDAKALEPALAAHQATLEGQARLLATTVEKVRNLRVDLTQGRAPVAGELTRLMVPGAEPIVAFDLPSPWGGERFELRDLKALNYITGPVSSGKTRLALRLAETLPGGTFLGLDRTADGGAAARAKLDADPALNASVDKALAWLLDDGATTSDALVALLVGLEAGGPASLIVDLVEYRLDRATQEALIAYLRSRDPGARPLFLMTRSCSILDLAAMGPDEMIIFCPANHSPPVRVAPYPGAPGYESVMTCLAPPEVRARTEDTVSWWPKKRDGLASSFGRDGGSV
jgi:DNA-binding transcriptional MerR regulator